MSERSSFFLFVVEDNQADARLLEFALEACGVNCEITRATDGEIAVAMLARFGQDLPWPDLMLVDLGLPKGSGLDLLIARRGSRQLSRIPVIVLTSSRRTADVDSAYEMGANAYMQKPNELNGMIDLANLLRSYWLGIVVRSSQSFET